jgi:hypothetical protein
MTNRVKNTVISLTVQNMLHYNLLLVMNHVTHIQPQVNFFFLGGGGVR